MAGVGVVRVPIKGDWFVRRSNDSELLGPYTYAVADSHARFMSAEDGSIGLAQIVTFVGGRLGDPIIFPARIRVDAYYARGKRFLQGRAAQFHADHELLESAADFGIRLYGFRG